MAFPDGPQQSSVDITAAFDAYMRQPETTPSKTFEEFLRNAGCGDASPSGVTGSKRKEAPKAGGHDDVLAKNQDMQRAATVEDAEDTEEESEWVEPFRRRH
ncbi:hypothetical protein LTR28_005452 [Elasticomyces elasticus]|nr:hypothetical protein LTR28_005452 [Elasticomyces elasticus]